MQIGANFESLAQELSRLLNAASTAGIVRVAVESSTNDIYFGFKDGQLHIDYWAPGLRGLWYRHKFKMAAAKAQLPVTAERWGPKHVVRVAAGRNPNEVAGLARKFFQSVYGASPGTYLLTIQPFGYSHGAA